MTFVLKQKAHNLFPPGYAPSVPVEPEIDPEELEHLFSGAVEIPAIPKETIISYSILDFLKKVTPQQNENAQPEEPRPRPETRIEREQLIQKDIEKFRTYAKDKRFENLDDEDLTNYFAINIIENFRFDVLALEEFLKSQKYRKLSSQDPAAEKYYLRAIAILKSYSPLAAPLEPIAPPSNPSVDTIPPPPIVLDEAPKPPLPTRTPSSSPQTSLPRSEEPAFDDPKEQAFHEKTKTMRATHKGASLDALPSEERVSFVARLIAEHYHFDMEAIRSAAQELAAFYEEKGKPIPPEEKESAEEAIRLIQKEIMNITPVDPSFLSTDNTKDMTAPTPEKKILTPKESADTPIHLVKQPPASATPIRPQEEHPLKKLLAILTKDYARGLLATGEFYDTERLIKKYLSSTSSLANIGKELQESNYSNVFTAARLESAGIPVEAPLLSFPKKEDAKPTTPPKKDPAKEPTPSDSAVKTITHAEQQPSSPTPASTHDAVSPPAPTPSPTTQEPEQNENAPQSREKEIALWHACEKGLRTIFNELFVTMNEVQRMHLVSAVKNHMEDVNDRTGQEHFQFRQSLLERREEMFSIIADAEKAYAHSRALMALHEEGAKEWYTNHERKHPGEEEFSQIIANAVPLTTPGNAAPLQIEEIRISPSSPDTKELSATLLLSSKENLLRTLYDIEPTAYAMVQKTPIRDVLAKRTPEKLVRLFEGYNLRTTELSYMTVRQFINKEIGFF